MRNRIENHKILRTVIFFFSDFSLSMRLQVRVCREKSSGHVYAMKKLKKSEMLRRGQVYNLLSLLVFFYLGFCLLCLFASLDVKCSG